tara:strand:+ start:1279 stop:1440 length:162 start_codon:yes stop_codon:yes gene_type:complete
MFLVIDEKSDCKEEVNRICKCGENTVNEDNIGKCGETSAVETGKCGYLDKDMM